MPLLTYIPEILEEHFEELAFLLHLREVQVDSGKMLYRQLIDLDDRIQGHIDGLLAVPEAAAAHASPLLDETDPLNLRAAAYILLKLHHTASIDKILAKLADPKLLPALASALVLARTPVAQAELKKIAAQFTHADAPVRALAWRLARQLAEPRTQPQYRAAFSDPDPAVRDAALLAAAWASQTYVLDACRPFLKKLEPASLVPLRLFATLALPAEAPQIIQLAQAAPLGPARFDILATSNLPGVVPHLLTAMRLPDPAAASAAADAFERLTNFMPPTRKSAVVAPAGAPPGDFDKEFLPEVNVPDPDAAQSHWASVESALASSPRIARGITIDPPPSPVELLDLDCACRTQVLLRNPQHPSRAAAWNFPQLSPAQ